MKHLQHLIFSTQYSSTQYFSLVSRSSIYVLVQFACIGFFLVTGPIFAHSFFGLLIEIIGLVIGLWAIAIMGLPKLTVFPEPKADGKLLRRGPYSVIRHPMYTAVILVCGSLALDRFEEAGLAVFAVLVINQLMKLRYEEKLLLRHFGQDYADYMKDTWAVLPYVF